MGYTHYWYRKPELDKEKFIAFSRDVHTLLSGTNIPLTHSVKANGEWTHDVDGFTATDDLIDFNGKGPDSHENFYIPQAVPEDPTRSQTTELHGSPSPGNVFCFTKTAYKPYDKLVVACLILGQFYFGRENFHISSDGDLGDWQEGLDLVNKTFGMEVLLVVSGAGDGFEVRDRIQDMKSVNMDEFEKIIDTTY